MSGFELHTLSFTLHRDTTLRRKRNQTKVTQKETLKGGYSVAVCDLTSRLKSTSKWALQERDTRPHCFAGKFGLWGVRW